MLSKIGAIGFKKESTAGTAETITTSEVIYAKNAKLAIQDDKLERPVLRSVPTPLVPLRGSTKCQFTADIEMKGSGTAGTPNTILGDLLECVGFVETADTGFRVTYVPDSDLTGLASGTAKMFLDGKYRTAKGCRGNGVFKFSSGKLCELSVDMQGGFVASGDTAVLAEPSDTIKPPACIGEMWLLEHNSANVTALASGSDFEGLRKATGANEMISTKIVNASAFKPKWLMVILQKTGTPAGETNGIWFEIQADSTGDPSGTAITNGTTATLATSLISTTRLAYLFEFATPPTMAGSTTYHVVAKGDWTGSDTNYVKVGTVSCLDAAEVSKTYSGSWSDLDKENMGAQLFGAAEPELVFGDVELNLNNEVSIDQNYNDASGYGLARLGGMRPEISFEPLEVLDATRDLRDYQANNTTLFWMARVGSTAGNKITFIAEQCKVSDDGDMGDRDGQVTHPLKVQVETPAYLSIVFE